MKTFFSATLFILTALGMPARAEPDGGSPVENTVAGETADLPRPLESAEPTTFDHVVYLARLPAPAELLKGAKGQGITITRMDQTGDRIVVVYLYSGGRAVTFAYTLLSAAAENPAPLAKVVSAPVSTAVFSEPVSSTAIVYKEPRTVYYSPRYVRYDEPVWDFWGPLALGVGIGWVGGHGHGWHGGGHGWHGSHGGHGAHGGRGGRHR